MYALTVKQPWAEAIARHGKTVENRTRRPPAHLLGQRIAIHVSQTWGRQAEEWRERKPLFWDLDHWTSTAEYQSRTQPHLAPAIELCRSVEVPNAGRIIATARLVGWVKPDGDHSVLLPHEWGCLPGDVSSFAAMSAVRSPWYTGPVGWVLADVRALREPVGHIRGQVYPFELSAEVEAAVLAEEVHP